jgi:hypothetical protein
MLLIGSKPPCHYVWLAYGNRQGYACQAPSRQPMQLARPFSLRLSPDQLQWLDAWRGDTFSRSTAIRLLIAEAIRLHRDGLLPATGRREP